MTQAPGAGTRFNPLQIAVLGVGVQSTHAPTTKDKVLKDLRSPSRCQRRVTRHRHRQRGSGAQAVVEFAIIFPVLIVMLAGSFSVYMAINTDIQMTSAARAGAVEASYLLANDTPPLTATDDSNAVAAAQSAANDDWGSSKFSQTQTPFTLVCSAPCVILTTPAPLEPPLTGTAVQEAQITVTDTLVPTVPFSFTINLSASANGDAQPCSGC